MDHSKGINMKRPAFTMIELVMVIVVLGILAALAIPRLDRDLRQEAKDNLLTAIRYTQHLALIDDKTDPTDTVWQSKLWNISFSGNDYNVSSNGNSAIDPVNGKPMDSSSGGSPNVLIGKKYSVNTVSFSGGCDSGSQIAFDHLGRPFKALTATNSYSAYMTTDCTITVGFAQSGITPSLLILTIEKETGHVSGD